MVLVVIDSIYIDDIKYLFVYNECYNITKKKTKYIH